MADNTIIKDGSGSSVTMRTKDIGSVQHSVVLLADSTGTLIDPVEQIAHDAVDSGDPTKMGAKAIAGLSTATLVSAADRTDMYAGLDGAQIIRPHCGLEDIVSGNASNTDGTSTACLAAAGAGIKQYLTSVIITNTSSSNIYVEIKDGATAKLTLPVPANSGCIFNPPVPIGGTANTAWNFDPSAAASTVYCSMIAFKSKV